MTKSINWRILQGDLTQPLYRHMRSDLVAAQGEQIQIWPSSYWSDSVGPYLSWQTQTDQRDCIWPDARILGQIPGRLVCWCPSRRWSLRPPAYSRPCTPCPGIRSHSSERFVQSPSLSPVKKNAHIIPNLRRAPDPPGVIVIEGRCESIPLEE